MEPWDIVSPIPRRITSLFSVRPELHVVFELLEDLVLIAAVVDHDVFEEDEGIQVHTAEFDGYRAILMTHDVPREPDGGLDRSTGELESTPEGGSEVK